MNQYKIKELTIIHVEAMKIPISNFIEPFIKNGLEKVSIQIEDATKVVRESYERERTLPLLSIEG